MPDDGCEHSQVGSRYSLSDCSLKRMPPQTCPKEVKPHEVIALDQQRLRIAVSWMTQQVCIQDTDDGAPVIYAPPSSYALHACNQIMGGLDLALGFQYTRRCFTRRFSVVSRAV
jgi:hypothetical protein